MNWTPLDSLLLYDSAGVLTTGFADSMKLLTCSLDASHIIPATRRLPDLPAGEAQDGTIKLAIDSEGIIFAGDDGFFISDEYGRNTINSLKFSFYSFHLSF